MPDVIDLWLIPLCILWILCLFVASKPLTRNQTPERTGLVTKKTHKRIGRESTTVSVLSIQSDADPIMGL
jgi:hypothetical protein